MKDLFVVRRQMAVKHTAAAAAVVCDTKRREWWSWLLEPMTIIHDKIGKNSGWLCPPIIISIYFIWLVASILLLEEQQQQHRGFSFWDTDISWNSSKEDTLELTDSMKYVVLVVQAVQQQQELVAGECQVLCGRPERARRTKKKKVKTDI